MAVKHSEGDYGGNFRGRRFKACATCENKKSACIVTVGVSLAGHTIPLSNNSRMAFILWHGDNESNDDSLFGDCGATYIFSSSDQPESGSIKRGLDSQQLARMSVRIKSLVDESAMVGAVHARND
jgi:hypothetical protein